MVVRSSYHNSDAAEFSKKNEQEKWHVFTMNNNNNNEKVDNT